MARKSKEVLRHFHTYTRKHSGSWRMHACRSLQQAHFKRWKPRQAIMHHSFLTDCTYIHWGSLGKFQKYALELQKCHTTRCREQMFPTWCHLKTGKRFWVLEEEFSSLFPLSLIRLFLLNMITANDDLSSSFFKFIVLASLWYILSKLIHNCQFRWLPLLDLAAAWEVCELHSSA